MCLFQDLIVHEFHVIACFPRRIVLQFIDYMGGFKMRDLFSAWQPNGYWIVAIFRDDGATETIRKANSIPLKTYYPIRFNMSGDPIPWWRNYLFIEFREHTTINVCRATSKFLKIINERDDEGVEKPILIMKNAIDESLSLFLRGKFNDRAFIRRFYGRGSLVRVLDGNFIDKRVKLECDVAPETPGSKKVPVSLGNWNGKIELCKLAL